MTTAETIPPAMTPEAWAEELEKLAADAQHGVPLWRSLDSNIAARRGPHALAALCLHGQPEGFTRRMADAIRIAAESANTPEHHDMLHAAADRIAALLPRA